MNRSGAPASCWLLCLIYVCYLLSHIACSALDGKIPLLALTGITSVIQVPPEMDENWWRYGGELMTK